MRAHSSVAPAEAEMQKRFEAAEKICVGDTLLRRASWALPTPERQM